MCDNYEKVVLYLCNYDYAEQNFSVSSEILDIFRLFSRVEYRNHS